MASTASSAWSAAIRVSVQSNVLKNLRAELQWANPAWAEQGRFDAASDTIMFLAYPDLSITTPLTPLTEGTPPTARALTMTPVTVATSQYGDIVGLTDVAKVKAPNDVVAIATERVTRTAKEVIDRITRDAVFLGGTPYYALGASTNAVRSDIASTEIAVGADLLKLRAKMRKNKVPFYSDGSYVFLASPNIIYDLQKDTTTATSWLDIAKYAKPDMVLDGEMGKLHGFRLVEVNNAPSFSSTTTVYAALALGGIKGWGAGELQTLSSYHVAPGGDHSDPIAQQEYVGWKINFGVATLNNSYYYRAEFAATSL
jgi:N4-gp56 family major capsid protein